MSPSSPRLTPALLAAAALLTLASTSARAGDQGAGAADLGPSRTVKSLGAVKVGQPLPSFAGPSLAATFALSRYLKAAPVGPVVVTVFATWCPNCVRQLPRAAEVVLAQQGARAGLVVIDVGEPEEEQVRSWFERHKLGSGPRQAVVLDPYQKISEGRLGVTVLPKTFVLDAGGVVRAIFEHEGDDFPEALSTELARAGGATAALSGAGAPP